MAERRQRRSSFSSWASGGSLKHFFDDRAIFKIFGARNHALKALDRAGLDYELVEDLRPFVVKISRYSKYAPLLKNSISFMETSD